MIREEDTHDQLIKAFRKYFEANQKWVNQGTRRAGMDARYWLLEIKKLCDQRRENIMNWRRWLNEETVKKKIQKKATNKD